MKDFITPDERANPSCGGRTAVSPPLNLAALPLASAYLFLLAFVQTGHGLLILGSLICVFGAAIESDSRALSDIFFSQKATHK